MALAMFVAMLSMSFVSCSDDDDDSNTSVTGSSIVGTWTRGTIADGEVLTLIFCSNGKGTIGVVFYDEETGKETSSTNLSFEYN